MRRRIGRRNNPVERDIMTKVAEFQRPSIDAQIACAEREVVMRRQVYPRRVAAKKMSEHTATYEIRTMEAIVETLRELKNANG